MNPDTLGAARAEANAPINAYQSRFMGPAGVGGGTTQGLSQIILLRLSIIRCSRPSFRFAICFGNRIESNTICTQWEKCSDNWPAFKIREHAHATRNTRRARVHTAGQIWTRNVRFCVLWIIDGIILEFPSKFTSNC